MATTLKNTVLTEQLSNTLTEQFRLVRKHTESICKNLHPEDLQLQASDFASPAKWHLAHTSWFFETFLLKPYFAGYNEFNETYNFFFNSYYESVGKRNPRPNRGLMSRPYATEVFSYRKYVDEHMLILLSGEQFDDAGFTMLFELGLQHEQQHQELLLTDIKYALSLNPLFPAVYDLHENRIEDHIEFFEAHSHDNAWISFEEGIYEIGASGSAFSFDNEHPRHKSFLASYSVRKNLVTNREFLEFMNSGGYSNFNYWHADARPWINENEISSPLYWTKKENEWFHYTLNGLTPLNLDAPVTHISFYEAFAFAEWFGMRLLTEQEWEIASTKLNWGTRWEWTSSAYLPYPGFEHAAGALGEYNGKFMVNQMVLRGASLATPASHSRPTYRNFFNPPLRWQFTGIRLARKHGTINT